MPARKRGTEKGKAKRKAAANPGQGKYRVTYANGRTARVDDISNLPTGTMVSWDEPDHLGRPTMRWTVTGGGWPFDD